MSGRYGGYWLDLTFNPGMWSRGWRRAFLITLPISGPIWFAVCACIIFLGLAAFLVAGPIYGLVVVFEPLPAAIKEFWSKP